MAVYQTGPSVTGDNYWDEEYRRRLRAQAQGSTNLGSMGQAALGASSAAANDARSGATMSNLGGAVVNAANNRVQQVQEQAQAAAAAQGGPQGNPAPDISSNVPAPSGGNRGIYRGSFAGPQNDTAWYGNVRDQAAAQLAQDREQQAYMWAQHNGYNPYVESLAAQGMDPFALQLLQGTPPTDPGEKLGFAGGVMNAGMAPMSANNGQSLYDSRAILQRIFTADGSDGSTDTLGQTLYGGANAMDPAGQVADTIKFVEHTLGPQMDPIVLQSYLNMLDRQGRAYLSFRMSPEGSTYQGNFGTWVSQNAGPTGGL